MGVATSIVAAEGKVREGQLVFYPCNDRKHKGNKVAWSLYGVHERVYMFGVFIERLVRMFCRKIMMMWPCLT